MGIPEKKQAQYPAPLQLVFADKGLVPNVFGQEELPSGLSLAKDKTDYTLRLEANQCLVLSPLEIIFEGSKQKSLTILLGESARMTLIERHQSEVVQEIDIKITLAPQAKLIHGKIITGDKKKAHKSNLSVSIAQGAFYDAFMLMAGEVKAQHFANIYLEGELAEVRLLGAQILRGVAQTQNVWKTHHLAAHGISQQSLKTVLSDKAEGFFKGKIYVAREAQKTDGYQLSRTLLLSDKAQMRMQPELEIYADDVKCSHGATTGALDEEALFYLRSRGIGTKEAKNILIRAFINGVVDQIQNEELRAAVYMEVEKEMV